MAEADVGARVVAWGDVAGQAAPGGIRKRSIEGAGAALVMVEVPAGTRAGRHSHPHEQFVQVVSGRGTLETAAGAFPFAAGSVFHFPADAWHAATFDADTVLVETNLAGRRLPAKASG